MSTKYKAIIPDKAYFITITCVNWVDVFTRLNHKYTIVNSLKYCQKNKDLEVFAYCIMPSHLHLICSANKGKMLSDIIRDFKKYTAKQLIDNIINEPVSRREFKKRTKI